MINSMINSLASYILGMVQTGIPFTNARCAAKETLEWRQLINSGSIFNRPLRASCHVSVVEIVSETCVARNKWVVPLRKAVYT